MAKVKYGAVISDTRGSVEGITFSQGRFGAFVRRRAIPRARQTDKVTAVRAGLGNIAGRWYGVLTALQRSDWIALAVANPVTDVFGNSHALTGQQFFIRVNQRLLQAGQSIISVCPIDQAVTGIVTLVVTATAPATLSIAFTVSPLSASHRLYIWATPSLSPGKVATRRDMKFIGVSGAAIATPYAAGAQYTARFGNMISGKLISVEVAVINTAKGSLSAYLGDTDVA